MLKELAKVPDVPGDFGKTWNLNTSLFQLGHGIAPCRVELILLARSFMILGCSDSRSVEPGFERLVESLKAILDIGEFGIK